ncbi:hypothetical protein ACFQ1S_21300, partial [Kibdelosporangium lantanae]
RESTMADTAYAGLDTAADVEVVERNGTRLCRVTPNGADPRVGGADDHRLPLFTGCSRSCPSLAEVRTARQLLGEQQDRQNTTMTPLRATGRNQRLVMVNR